MYNNVLQNQKEESEQNEPIYVATLQVLLIVITFILLVQLMVASNEDATTGRISKRISQINHWATLFVGLTMLLSVALTAIRGTISLEEKAK